MLFDLRSRGRRTTVRGVYLALAILMGGGLVLFGVGTGVGGGGLLNAFGGGGGTSQNQAVNAAERKAEKAVKANPSSAAARAALLEARWTTATTDGTGFDIRTGRFTKLGISELTKLTQDWQRYLSLTKHPSAQDAILAARAYGSLGQYGPASDAWDVVSLAIPNDTTAYECFAISAYAAGQTRKGDLAAAKVMSLLPKAQRSSIKLSFDAAKKKSSTAKQIAAQNCQK